MWRGGQSLPAEDGAHGVTRPYRRLRLVWRRRACGLFGAGACGAGAGAGGAKNGGTVAAGGTTAQECCLASADAIPASPRLPKSSFDIA